MRARPPDGASLADLLHDADDAYRAQRLRSLAARGWPYALAVLATALLAALGFWLWTRHAEAQGARASITYADGLAALQANRPADADKAFAQVADAGPGAYRALALMQRAGVKLSAHRPADALRFLDEAAHVAPDRVIGDAARLEAAYVAMDSESPGRAEGRLQPLLDAKGPYRQMAREALGAAKLAGGRPAEARRDFQLLSLSQDVSDNTRARAQAALAMIDGGSAKVVSAAVKAELALPPLPDAPAGAGAGAPPGAQ